jgi:uncharacterized protein YbjT (DUF2867 family)
MRIFVAGASGVIGTSLVPLLVDAGHTVAGMTHSPEKLTAVRRLGAKPVRMLSEGTRNLIAAAQAAHAMRLLAQSIAWELPGDRGIVYREHERAELDAGGVVIRYGQLYGAGTYYHTSVPSPPRIGVADVARRTVESLEAPTGIVEVVE